MNADICGVSLALPCHTLNVDDIYMLSIFLNFINDDRDDFVEVGGNGAGQSSNRGLSDQDSHKVFIPFRAYSARKGVRQSTQYNTKNKNVVFLYSYNLSNFPFD